MRSSSQLRHRLLVLAALVGLAAQVGAQSGLQGEYFNAATPPPPGTAADFERVDDDIDFVWFADAPDGTSIVPDDFYSQRWTGWVKLPTAGIWAFFATSNDGARLWIDEQLVVDDWVQHFTRTRSGTLPAESGWHTLRMEHYNSGGTAVARLEFQGPNQPRSVIPTGSLCPDGQCRRSGARDFLSGWEADAGPDRFLLPPATSLTLHGSIRRRTLEDSPANVSIAWGKVSGPPTTILDKNTLTPTIIPAGAGPLRLLMKVQDRSGQRKTDEVLVHVFGANQDGEISGELRKWNKVALTFQHDAVLTEGGTPNPFLDLRLFSYFYNVESGALYSVPGFFAADGNAAETGSTGGNRWRVNFTPDHAGTWYYYASFRSGPEIAVDLDPDVGTPLSFDGANGTFTVAPADPLAPGFLSKGRLEYVGQHHLRCAETHESFLKGGTDSPENFLGYYEFDNTFDQGGSANDLESAGAADGLHHYDAHLADYVDLGVPTWKNGKGQRIFGALSYLASRGVNSLYALTFNIDGGDGREVWPWTLSGANKLRFDISKLAQWERVVDHMTRAGIAWHVVTQETENDHVLDGGALDVERKLYYRELVARFGHAPGLVWNLGEENDNSTEERKSFADYIRALDPYAHPIGVHNRVGDLNNLYGPLLGTHLELVSIQADPSVAASTTRQLVDDSTDAGRPWVVNFDEQTPASDGALPDADDFWHDALRRTGLWPSLMAQGGGCEWYFGYAHPNSDLDCEDFRSRDNLWLVTARALDFLQSYLPFEGMEHADALATGNAPSTLAQRGALYAVYLPFGGSSQLNLEANTGPFLVSWFDARNGGVLQSGSVTQISGPGTRSLGLPPAAGDWIAFVRRATNLAPAIESVSVEPDPFVGNQDFSVLVHVSDPNGPSDTLTVTLQVQDPAGSIVGTFPATHRGGSLYSLFLPARPPTETGTWHVSASVLDSGGLSDTHLASFEAH